MKKIILPVLLLSACFVSSSANAQKTTQKAPVAETKIVATATPAPATAARPDELKSERPVIAPMDAKFMAPTPAALSVAPAEAAVATIAPEVKVEAAVAPTVPATVKKAD